MPFADLRTGELLADRIENVYYGLEWGNDNRTLFYITLDEAKRPWRVHRHVLGTPTESDAYELGKEFPRIAEIGLQRSPDGTWILANVQNGDGGEFVQYLRGHDGRWTQLTQYADKVIDAVFGHDGSLYLLSRAGAPRGKVLRLALPAEGAPSFGRAKLLIPESDGVIKAGFPFGRPAGAGVADHLPTHLVPRWTGDTSFMTVVGEVRVLPEEIVQTAERLRPVFAGLVRRPTGA